MTNNAIAAPKTYYVYTYAFPDGTVFYVGKGTNCRIFDHEREAEGGCECEKCCTIRQIWASGKPVQKRILYETFVEQEALLYEQKLIKRIFNSSALTNVRDNPQKFSPTCEVNSEIYCSPSEAYKRFNVTAPTLRRWAQRRWVKEYVSAIKHRYYCLNDLERVTSMMTDEEWQQVRPYIRS